MRKIKWTYMTVLFVILLLYTRFLGLDWGLPYPFHPDERNLAVALQQLTASGNPHFFAYGQLPLYLGWVLNLGKSVSLEQAILSLRAVSAGASILTVYFMWRLTPNTLPLTLLLFIFSPALIQWAHFGTTESLLMLFYTALVYYSLFFLNKKIPDSKFQILASILCGAAIATKVSSIIFISIPILAFLIGQVPPARWDILVRRLFKLIFLTVITVVIFSLHSLVSFNEFISSIRYESDVALGNVIPFYTRQFIDTIPVLFQFEKIFPYILGLPVFVLFLIAFFTLPYDKNLPAGRQANFLRFAFLIYFVPTAFIFAKWARFMAPIIPLMLIFAALLLQKLKNIKVIAIITIISIMPGIMFLSVYQRPDLRFQASEWIYKNIPSNSYILSETANVVDLPISAPNSLHLTPNYNIISFDFYNLDENPLLQDELRQHIGKADYIFIPSRRVFANHPRKDYPIANKYYQNLFSGKLGFQKVAEFKVLNDENAEETWTVFDHPVIRIYKRT